MLIGYVTAGERDESFGRVKDTAKTIIIIIIFVDEEDVQRR